MKIHTSRWLNLWLPALLVLMVGCHFAPHVGEQDARARRLLSDLNRNAVGVVQAAHASGSLELREHQPLPDFARTVEDLNGQVGRLKTVTRRDARVSRSMADEKTNLTYHLTGDRGQANVKIYLTRRREQWVLDGLRVGDSP